METGTFLTAPREKLLLFYFRRLFSRLRPLAFRVLLKQALEKRLALVLAVPFGGLLAALHALTHFLGLDALVVIADLFFLEALILPVFFPLLSVLFAQLALAFKGLLLLRCAAAFLRRASIPKHEQTQKTKYDS